MPSLLSKNRPVTKYSVLPTVPPYSKLGVKVWRLPP